MIKALFQSHRTQLSLCVQSTEIGCRNYTGSHLQPVTRMHSSRMCTARFSCRLGRGGEVSAWGVGLSAYGGVCPGRCLPRGSLPSEVYTPNPLHAGIHPLPVNRITDRCKNITLATTSLRPVKRCKTLPKETVGHKRTF